MDPMERAALAALFRATDGVNWKRNDNWNTDGELSRWYGVEVNDQGSVMKLLLSGNDLKGKSLPPVLRGFPPENVFVLVISTFHNAWASQVAFKTISGFLQQGYLTCFCFLPFDYFTGVDITDVLGRPLSGLLFLLRPARQYFNDPFFAI